MKAQFTRRRMMALVGTGGMVLGVGGGMEWLVACNGHSDRHPSLPLTSATPVQRAPHLFCRLQGHSDRILSVAWSPDCAYLVSGSLDYSVKIWHVANQQLSATYGAPVGHTDTVTSVAWSPTSNLIATGSWDKTVKVWDFSTNTLITTFRGHTHVINAVAWSPDGRFVASGSSRPEAAIKVWDISTKQNILTYSDNDSQGKKRNVHTVAWSPDGQSIAFGTDGNAIYIHNALTGQLVSTYHGHKGQVNALAWAPKELGKSYIVSGSGVYEISGPQLSTDLEDTSVQVWNASACPTDTCQTIARYTGHTWPTTSVAWSSSGYIVSGSTDKTVHVCVLQGKQLQLVAKYSGHNAIVDTVAYSPDEQYIASAGDDNSIHVWSI